MIRLLIAHNEFPDDGCGHIIDGVVEVEAIEYPDALQYRGALYVKARNDRAVIYLRAEVAQCNNII